MTPSARKHFDDLLESILDALPDHLLELLDEVPLIVEDEPSAKLLKELGEEDGDDLCGLHSGVALTERSVERSGDLPDRIMLFRGPIARLAAEERPGDAELRRQIRITLLHEIGHHFGLDEDELEELGYG